MVRQAEAHGRGDRLLELRGPRKLLAPVERERLDGLAGERRLGDGVDRGGLLLRDEPAAQEPAHPVVEGDKCAPTLALYSYAQQS